MKMNRIFSLLFIILFCFSVGLFFTSHFIKSPSSSNQTSSGFSEIPQDLATRDVHTYGPISSTYFTGIWVSGDYAFMSSYSGGSSQRDLAIIDISDPTNPGPAYYLQNDTTAYAAIVEGDYAFIANTEDGLLVANLSDPTTPSVLSKMAVDPAYGLDVDGDYLYLASMGVGLRVIDISDPTNPHSVILLSTSGSAYDVFISGDYAYVANGLQGLAVVDITNPTSPSLVGSRDTSGFAQGIFVAGDFCYIATGSAHQLAIINITDPTNPGSPTYVDFDDEPKKVFVSGDFCYVAASWSGLAVIDISNPLEPSAPHYQKMYQNRNAMDVFIAGEYAYIPIEDWGLNIVKIGDLIDPEIPFYGGVVDSAMGVFIDGDYAYIADDKDGGLLVIDISNPQIPLLRSSYSTGQYTRDVFISGDWAYVANWEMPSPVITVINISDPVNPGPSYNCSISKAAFDVVVSGDYAYFACGEGLLVVNISDPTNPKSPVLVEKIGMGSAYGLDISGNFVYTAQTGGIVVFNVTDPTNPQVVTNYTTSQPAYAIDVKGNHAYVANNYDGLAIFDISNPYNLGAPIYANTTGRSVGIFVEGDRAYIADSSSGLAIIDISNLISPGSPIYRNTALDALDVFVSGAYAYVAIGSDGLAVIKIMEPWYALNSTVLEPITPNPDFDGQISLNWNLVENATLYYIYRNTSSITTMTGLSPIANTTTNNYIDLLLTSGTYYYAISAGNSRGRSWISNTQNVSCSPSQLTQGDYGTGNLTSGLDLYILNPQPLPMGVIYGFYMCNLGTYDYNILIQGNGSYYAGSYAPAGANDWIIWHPAGPTNFTTNIIYNSGDNTTYQYHFMNSTSIPLGYNPSSFDGKGELLQVNFNTVGTYALRVWNAPDLRFRVFGPILGDISFNTSNNPFTEIWNSPVTTSQNRSVFSISVPGSYVILVNRENNLTNIVNYDLYVALDSDPPAIYILESPVDWINNQTPPVICRFYEAVSGVNISSAEFAYSTDGNMTPTNWVAVDGVYTDLACTDPAENWDSGWLYAKVNAVPFNHDSETENIIRFRICDMAGALGTSAPFIIKIDTRAPLFFMIDTPTDWVTNQTPRVGFAFNEVLDGLNVSTVEYSYSINGNTTWSSWIPVDGVYSDSSYTTPAVDGEDGWVWGEILAIPFNQDSEINNTIRFRARDLAGNLGISDNYTIKIDSTPPDSFILTMLTDWSTTK
ncbi:MAG TPA: hypothetical protein VMV49_05410, partial [Candidatus Deferrimicrobium sp.]|nr:hypothetical protein [Candidatus Deferrimicrobium sp.]